MKTMIPRTYEEAKTQGYSIAFLRYQRGYISRNTNIDKAPVMVAGGARKGMLYVLVPCWKSTQYCQRMYLTK